MSAAQEFDLQINRPSSSSEYLHIHYHPLLPKKIHVRVNGEAIAITHAEAGMICEFLHMLEREHNAL